jgi:hypothetical protein
MTAMPRGSPSTAIVTPVIVAPVIVAPAIIAPVIVAPAIIAPVASSLSVCDSQPQA